MLTLYHTQASGNDLVTLTWMITTNWHEEAGELSPSQQQLSRHRSFSSGSFHWHLRPPQVFLRPNSIHARPMRPAFIFRCDREWLTVWMSEWWANLSRHCVKLFLVFGSRLAMCVGPTPSGDQTIWRSYPTIPSDTAYMYVDLCVYMYIHSSSSLFCFVWQAFNYFGLIAYSDSLYSRRFIHVVRCCKLGGSVASLTRYQLL